MAETPRKVDCKSCERSTPIYQLSKKGECVHCVAFGGPERFDPAPKKASRSKG